MPPFMLGVTTAFFTAGRLSVMVTQPAFRSTNRVSIQHTRRRIPGGQEAMEPSLPRRSAVSVGRWWLRRR